MKVLGRIYNSKTKNVEEEDISRFTAIQFGEGLTAVRVVIRDGQVQVRTTEGFLVLEPRSANSCVIKAVEPM